MKFAYRLCFAILVLALALQAGCGKNDGGRNQPATQVAAKVNSYEITVHQINNFLVRAPNVAPEVADRAKAEILARLIDQQLARQKAIEKKLDQSPGVLQALEAANLEILARAYFDHIVASLPKPTPGEVKKYYSEHPELFAQRRLFSIEEIVFSADDRTITDLHAVASKSKSIQEVTDWLADRQIAFVANRGMRAAEQIPLDLLPRLQRLRDGDIQIYDAGKKHQVVRLVGSKFEPIDQTAAVQRIQQFLANQRAREAITKELKQLREQARIEYMGEFVGGAVEAKAKAAAPSGPAQIPRQNIEKGAGGLY